ncbi:hypothetical protein ILYODFUR_023532 [Ilyodon furcidens]|uniref:Uncharacterized protein n=1 Tax=Ilyodon furcidens TaxID=33524 RepID=A0ABV0VGI4_9TELE
MSEINWAGTESPTKPLNNPSVSQRAGEKECRRNSYIMTRVLLAWGRGAGVAVTLHSLPAVSLNLLQGKVQQNSCNIAPEHALQISEHSLHSFEGYSCLDHTHKYCPAHFSCRHHTANEKL